MANVSYQSDRAWAVWKTTLASAFRTAFACTIVGCITLFGPESIKRQVAFPAFSYVTVIIIVTDSTLGDTIRGCMCAIYATIQSVLPAILTLWLIGPARLTTGITSAAVAINAFMVVLPENTHLITKRIALGQIVITYVIAFINGAKTEPVMHPLHVAASTAVGVVSCLLALSLPYPTLASYEVKQNCKRFAENASERLKLFLKAFTAEDNTSALAFISQAKILSGTGAKVIQSIKSKQESMQWEKVPFKFLKPFCKNPGEKLQDIETPLKGMELALSTSSFPISMLNPELKDDLTGLEEHVLYQFNSISLNSATVPEPNSENVSGSLQTLQTIPTFHKDLPSLFFLFCLKLLQNKSLLVSSTSSSKENLNDHQNTKHNQSFFSRLSSNLAVGIKSKRFIPAFRSALSLGLAVFLGLIYSKEDGYWSGLPVAISLAAAREATFKIANVKAQGTVLGTVYGVLGCYLFERYVNIRFISLLPWFIISGFLRQSRMYGQAGGISAVIGALLILGRKGFGHPSDFAISRITETFIGLSCSIMVDIALQPTRASTLARIHLSKSLQMLHDSICSINLHAGKSNSGDVSQKKLKLHLNKLGKFIAEADAEPNFWFVPFHSACYNKLFMSLSKMTQFLLFGNEAIRFFEEESGRIDSFVWKEIVSKLDDDLKLFKDMISSSIKCFEETSIIKSIPLLDKELQKKSVTVDIEMGKSPLPFMMRGSSSSSDEDEILKHLSVYLQHSEELLDNIENVDERNKELKSKLVLSLSTLAFCMSSLVRETREIDKSIKELVQWGNPSSQVNLHEISLKIRALANTTVTK